MNLGTCQVCNRPVTNLESSCRYVEGWYRTRSKGLNALIDRREDPDKIAHEICLRHPPGQGSFAA